jgi:hypothetical protein
MKVEFFIRTDSNIAEIEIDMEGELGVDFDKDTVGYAIQDKLEADGIDIDSGELPEEMELTFGFVQVMSL